MSKAEELSAASGLTSALVSRSLARLLGLAFVVVLARAVEPSVFAGYSYLLVLAAAIGLVTESGIALVAGREVAQGRHGIAAVHRAGAVVVAGTAALAALLVLAAGAVDAGPGTAGWPLAWTAAFIAVNTWGNFQSELLRAGGMPWVEAGLQMLGAVLLVATGIAVLALGLGLAALMFTLVLKQLVVVVLAQRRLPWPWHGAPDPHLSRRMLTTGLWLGAATACLGLVLRAAYLALGNAGSDQDVAEFAIASRVLEVTVMVSQTAGFGLLPAMAQRAVDGTRPAYRTALAAAIAVSAVLSAALIPAVPHVLPALFGERYDGAVPAAQVILAFTPAIVALHLAWYALVASRGERTVLAAAVSALLVALAGSFAVRADPDPVTTALATCVPLTVAALVVSVRVWWRRT